MTDQLCLLAVCSFCPAQASCQVWNSGCELVGDQPNPIPSPVLPIQRGLQAARLEDVIPEDRDRPSAIELKGDLAARSLKCWSAGQAVRPEGPWRRQDHAQPSCRARSNASADSGIVFLRVRERDEQRLL